jgi:hypothetical protein
MAMPIPNLSFTGGEAKSGVEGDTRSDGAWAGGGRTRVNVFAPDAGVIGIGAGSSGGSTLPSMTTWLWAGGAALAVVAVLALRRK